MTVTEAVMEFEVMGGEWGLHPAGGIDFIEPIVPPAQAARLREVARVINGDVAASAAVVEAMLLRRAAR